MGRGLAGQNTQVAAVTLHCGPICCGRFIHDWVYGGVFRDVCGEFMIQVNHEYLGFRGRRLLGAGLRPYHQVGQGQCSTPAGCVSCPPFR